MLPASAVCTTYVEEIRKKRWLDSPRCVTAAYQYPCQTRTSSSGFAVCWEFNKFIIINELYVYSMNKM